MRRRKMGMGKTTHDYTKPARAVDEVEGEEEEQPVEKAPKVARKFTWFVTYTLPEIALTPEETPADMDPSVPIHLFDDTVIASDRKEAIAVLKAIKQPAAERISARIAVIGLFWRKAGSKDEWKLASHTWGCRFPDGRGEQTPEEEARFMDWEIEEYKAKPFLLLCENDKRYTFDQLFSGFEIEFTTRLYKSWSGDDIPDWLDAIVRCARRGHGSS